MLRAVVLAAVLAAPLPAAGQSVMFQNLQTDLLAPRLLLAPVTGLDAQSRTRMGAPDQPRATPTRTPAPPARATTYAATPAVSARVRQQYVSWFKGISPAEAPKLDAVLARTDHVTEWGKMVRAEGLKPGDVADSLSSYWLLNWMIANGRTDGSPAQAIAVRDQTRRVLATNSRFAALTPAQKQEASEIWMLNFLVQVSAYNHALETKDADLQRRLAQAARQRFQNEMGVDLTKLSLTPAGLVPRA